MTKIRDRLQTKFPARATELLPVNMIWGESIPKDEEINRWFQRLSGLVHIGGQYKILANFARNCSCELELCVEKDAFLTIPPSDLMADHSAELLLFRDFVGPSLNGKGHECRVEGPFPEPAVEMFKYFRFPVSHLTKAEMRTISEEKDFFDIMELIWFCHYPKQGLPCGKCRPCQIAPATGIEYTFYQPTALDKIGEMKKHVLKRKK